MISTGPTRRLPWVIASLSLAMVAISVALIVLTLAGQDGDWLLPIHSLLLPAVTIAYALVGALVSSRQWRNPIGWILTATGLLSGLAVLVASYVSLSEAASGGPLPGVEMAQWLDDWLWMPTIILPTTFLFLLFPDGHLPSPRWRPVAWSAALGIAAFILHALLVPKYAGGITSILDERVNALLPLIEATSYALYGVGAIGSVAALIVRFRRSRGIEREQLKWLAYGGVIVMMCFALSGILSAIWPTDRVLYEIVIMLVQVGMGVVAVATGIAILRYRLYNIDLLINRTLVYGALSAGVVGLYVLIVGSLGLLFQSSGNFALALIATGLAALVVQPLRSRLQRGVNHLMYGERDDPYTVLSSLSQQLKTTLAPTAVLPSIAEAIALMLKLPYVALSLKQGNGLQIAAAYGVSSGEPVQLPLIYQAETVGALLVEPRGPGESFTPGERRLLEDIALQAGVAAHAVRLTAELQQARERLVTAREEERRRLRRDLHDGLGPQLASMTLTVGAARELLRQDVQAADLLLQELAGHAQSAITDIRRVVYALRPPALDDLGLVPALREQAAFYSRAGLLITIDATEHLPVLPAAVEVAAYRIVQEALTNVVRHSRANRCRVSLAATLVDTLDIEIKDDGVGLPAGGRAGVGLASMRERSAELGGTCKIESLPDVGTRISARLPLHQASVRQVQDAEEGVWTTSAS